MEPLLSLAELTQNKQALQEREALESLLSLNEKTERYGLALSGAEAKALLLRRRDALRDTQRVEFGEGVLPALIYAFCDSPYMERETYGETLGALMETFYLYKNEAMDALSDAELIGFMRRQFDKVCFGDLDYLRGTCLERFARALRAGYLRRRPKPDAYSPQAEADEYAPLDEETRWDYELFEQALKGLF